MLEITELKEMKKDELIELVMKLQSSKGGRKDEVLSLIKTGNGDVSISFIATELLINKKNVSSVLSGLKKDGHMFVKFGVDGESLIQWIGQRDENGIIKNINNEEVDQLGRLI